MPSNIDNPDDWSFGRITCWRPQREAVAAIEGRFAAGDQSTLNVMPTGSGKTTVVGAVAAREVKAGGRVLLLAHRDELITQARNRMMEMGLDPAIEKAERRIEDHADMFGGDPKMVIATVQTLKGGRLGRLAPDYFSLVITDEAHHAAADSYRAIYRHFAGAKHLGVTATADRGDNEPLGDIFKSVAYEYKLVDAVKDGWLCRIRVVNIPTTINLSGVRTTAGDLNAGDLEQLIVPHVEELANKVIDAIGDRKTIVFTPDVGSSYLFARAAEQLGVRAEAVSGGLPICPRCGTICPVGGECPAADGGCGLEPRRTHCVSCWAYAPPVFEGDIVPPYCLGCRGRQWRRGWKSRPVSSEERAAKLKRFADGETRMLCNCALLLEGYDCKDIAAVVLLRPTKSRSLACQMIGRGTRVAPGKEDLLVVDFSVLTGRHELVKPARLFAPDGTDEEVLADVQKAVAAGKPVDILAEMEAAQKRMQERLKREAERARQTRRIDPKQKFRRRSLIYGRVEYDPLNIAEEILGVNPSALMPVPPELRATPGQVGLLAKFGVPNAAGMPKREASKAIGKLIRRADRGLATIKQTAYLRYLCGLAQRRGIDVPLMQGELTMQAASGLIDDLKKKLKIP